MRVFAYLMCLSLAWTGVCEAAPSKQKPTEATTKQKRREVGKDRRVRSGQKSQGKKSKPLRVPRGVKRVVSRQQRMTLSFYRQLRRNKGNILFAPHGLSVVLSMLRTGARGVTARGIKRVLHGRGISTKRWHSAMGWLHKYRSTTPHKGVILRSAQNFWMEHSGVPKVSFIRSMQRYYNAAPLLMHFHKQPEVARTQINDWFRLQTHGMIPSLFPKGSIDKRTRLVVGHALFFQGSWAYPFKKKYTELKTFFVAKRRVISTPLMYQKRKFRYAASRGLQILELPYAGHQFSMVLLLPRLGGLARLEKRLRTSRLRRWIRRLRLKKVHVSLPRFTLTSTWNFLPALAALGMSRALGRRADFSKINGKRNLYVSTVLQQTKIAVDEKGTKASAATALVVRTKNGHSYPEFVADRPFLFYIRDRQTHQILFWGRVTNPNPKAKIRSLPKHRKRN